MPPSDGPRLVPVPAGPAWLVFPALPWLSHGMLSPEFTRPVPAARGEDARAGRGHTGAECRQSFILRGKCGLNQTRFLCRTILISK